MMSHELLCLFNAMVLIRFAMFSQHNRMTHHHEAPSFSKVADWPNSSRASSKSQS